MTTFQENEPQSLKDTEISILHEYLLPMPPEPLKPDPLDEPMDVQEDTDEDSDEVTLVVIGQHKCHKCRIGRKSH